jgi:hypothetical protein
MWGGSSPLEANMFCDGCGAPVQAGQGFCGRCGKQIVGNIAVMPRRGRVAAHLQLLGILWLAFSALHAIAGVLLLFVNAVFIHKLNAPPFLHPLLAGIGWFVLVKSAAGLAAGFGLMQREPWARTLALILGFISLFTSIPFGTALGIYTMWVLMSQESEREYDAISATRAA